jgi:hypothetical protein
MADNGRLAMRVAVYAHDENGNRVGVGSTWLWADGSTMSAEDALAREARMEPGRFSEGQRVQFTADSGNVYLGDVDADVGGGTYLIRLDDGRRIGVPMDRLDDADPAAPSAPFEEL